MQCELHPRRRGHLRANDDVRGSEAGEISREVKDPIFGPECGSSGEQ